ncbi:MAG: glycosyltransferase family 4 protein [Patescibacteria group bacterium]|nr:glycosyltransferase family 4 protein [Patescibacteria group bacterium]
MEIDRIKFKLFAFPLALKAPNAYWDNLYGEIAKSGEVKIYNNDFWKLLFSFNRPQIVHLHWPTILYASRYSIIRPIKLLIRLKILLLSKLRGDILVWTMHNYKSHESGDKILDKIAMTFLVKFSDSIIVHTEAGKIFLAQKYKRLKNVYIIEHGNYVNFHGPIKDRPDDNLLRRLGLTENDKVYLSLGSIKRYKGLEKIIKVFNQLPRNNKLLIAGKSFDQSYLDDLKALAKNQNIIFSIGTIPGDDLPSYFSLARASLFSFNEVLTSGSVILSLSYAVPVLVPAEGDLPYIIKDDFNGFLYHSEAEFRDKLSNFILMSDDKLTQLKKGSFGFANNLSYNKIAKKTLVAYKILK